MIYAILRSLRSHLFSYLADGHLIRQAAKTALIQTAWWLSTNLLSVVLTKLEESFTLIKVEHTGPHRLEA